VGKRSPSGLPAQCRNRKKGHPPAKPCSDKQEIKAVTPGSYGTRRKLWLKPLPCWAEKKAQCALGSDSNEDE